MKKNIDFYIILFICVLACGILYFLCDHTDEYSVSKTGNVFVLRGTGYGVSSPKGATNGNSWTLVGGSGQTTATSRVRVSAPSSARSHSQFQGSSYLPMISSPATLSSSRVSYSAFGGSAKGSATVGSSAKTMPTQSMAYRGLTQPLAYGGRTNAVSSNSQRSLLESSPTSYVSANVGNDAIRQSVRQSSTPSLVGASSYTSVYAHNSRGLSVYGDYATVGEAMTSPYRASAQHRAPPTISGGDREDDGGDNEEDDDSGSWLNWLDHYYGDSKDFNGIEGAREAYNLMFGFWNDQMGVKPTFEEFLEWLQNGGDRGYTINGNTYRMPIGDILPLILIALAYMAMMFVRKRKELIK